MLFASESGRRERPLLLTPILCVVTLFAVVLLVCGVLSLFGRMSFALGAALLGSGLEVMGPAPYFFLAAMAGLSAWGLWHGTNWGRRLTIALCAIGVFLQIEPISSAATDRNWLALFFLWLEMAVRVIVASVLLRERDAFR